MIVKIKIVAMFHESVEEKKKRLFRTFFPCRFWILMIALQWSCHPSDSYKFEGKWQSLNSPGSVVAFTPDKKMIFYKDKVSLWAQATKHGELTYTFTTVQGPWYHFEAFDGNEFFTGGRIETVDENRIRIYFHKHHNILDLADEYYRTDDFESYQQIMERILSEPV